jgi:hypothetical protein
VTLTVAQPAPPEAGCYLLRQQVFADGWMKLPRERASKIAVVQRDGGADGGASCT